ncbi:MAG: NYN domain-containing protein [Bosea sp. (in: a-proteobacteria)]
MQPKIAVFIDGANLYATAKALGFDIDYRRLLKEFQGRGYLIRAFYYTTLVENDEYSSIRPLVDWLDYNGYTVVTKAAREFTDAMGRRRIKGNMDIELTIDALNMAEKVDEIYVLSGDGDFRPLVEELQRRGVRVNVVSSVASQPPMVSDELRRQCDEFIDIASLKVRREPTERPVRDGGIERTVRAPAPAPAPGLERRYGIKTEGESEAAEH